MSPIVMVDHFVMTAPTFEPHPHAGISAVTMMFEDAIGRMRSVDSLGHENVIGPGDVHWTVAGSGIVHTQEPIGGGCRLHALQIFVNLPHEMKSLPPRTIQASVVQQPVIERNGIRLRVIAGHLDGAVSPLQIPQPCLMIDGIAVKDDVKGHATLPLRAGWNFWVYAVAGTVRLKVADASPLPDAAHAECALPAGTATAASPTRCGGMLLISAKALSHFVVLAGPSLTEPVVQRGPLVMTSEAEIEAAIEAYRSGRFGHVHLRGSRSTPL